MRSAWLRYWKRVRHSNSFLPAHALFVGMLIPRLKQLRSGDTRHVPRRMLGGAGKIGILRADLQATISDADTEHRNLGAEHARTEAEWRKVDDELQRELTPYRASADSSLGELIRLKGSLSRAKDLQDELTTLQSDLAVAVAARAAKPSASKAALQVDTRRAQEFCQVVAKLSALGSIR